MRSSAYRWVWAIELPAQRPSSGGTTTCPDLFGGTNFMSPSFDPSTGLFYVSARETCMTFTAQAPPEGFKAGDRAMGGTLRATDRGYGALRAIDPVTGERKWELRHPTPSWAGVWSTSGGVVFSAIAKAMSLPPISRTGKELWRYQVGAPVYAAPSTYMIGARQYVIVPAGTTLTAFALPQH
jgi:alcohol dehydrogenase (cytochrome c)